jgi:proteasome lid subunit RPN8/RPN11
MQVPTSKHVASDRPAPFRASAAPVALEQLREHARQAAPRECCGLLLGRMTESGAHVVAAAPSDNAAAQSVTHFLIPADVVLATQRAGERDGLDVVGFYHSHPRGDARPSPTDVEGAPAGYLHVIVAGGQVRAWRRAQPDAPLEEVLL